MDIQMTFGYTIEVKWFSISAKAISWVILLWSTEHAQCVVSRTWPIHADHILFLGLYNFIRIAVKILFLLLWNVSKFKLLSIILSTAAHFRPWLGCWPHFHIGPTQKCRCAANIEMTCGSVEIQYRLYNTPDRNARHGCLLTVQHLKCELPTVTTTVNFRCWGIVLD